MKRGHFLSAAAGGFVIWIATGVGVPHSFALIAIVVLAILATRDDKEKAWWW